MTLVDVLKYPIVGSPLPAFVARRHPAAIAADRQGERSGALCIPVDSPPLAFAKPWKIADHGLIWPRGGQRLRAAQAFNDQTRSNANEN